MSINTTEASPIKYAVYGRFTAKIRDRKAAKAYLRKQDMRAYLDDTLREKITDISWTITSRSRYEVEIEANQVLTSEDKRELSDWIHGQHSDGMGEGFEQQDFGYDLGGGGILDDEDHSVSFDWETNRCEVEGP